MSVHVHVPRFVMPTMLLSFLLSQLRPTLFTMKGILTAIFRRRQKGAPLSCVYLASQAL